ncbi:MAG: 3-dehydroquinate synthase [Bacteroidales bacterium]|nr:3-dehydroquinate synthase [Bacteroidales bacterium]
MTTFKINTSGAECKILVGESIENFTSLVPEHAIVITDENVNRIYGKVWKGFKTIITTPGEKHKTLATLEDIYRQLLDFGVDRSGFILGIGGGIVCDIAGFAASTYMRGIRFGFVPTTLLAQVDASIGGKNGVNFHGFKNMAGTFSQPNFILSDPEVLKTLPAEELSNGFAEIVKHALIADAEMFDFIEENAENMLQLNPEVINHLIKRSVEIKSGIVNRDEKEKGERRILNFGHTFGHAIEKVSGISHGKAVALGSVIAGKLSVQRNYMNEKDLNRIIKLLECLELPIKFQGNKNEVLDALFKDKKREQDAIFFVLLQGIGRAFVEKIMVEELKQLNF